MRTAAAVAVMLVASACTSAPTAGIHTAPTHVVIDTTGGDFASRDTTWSGYPPALLHFPLPPLPIPKRMMGTRVEAAFTINERGEITRLSMKHPADRAYGRKLAEAYLTFRFRPATTLDGKPTTGIYRFTYDF